jgi:hypothetical protein
MVRMLRSVLDIDRRNCPHYYDGDARKPDGNAVSASTVEAAPARALTLIQMGDVDRLMAALKDWSWVIEPLIFKGEVTQVVGYNGSGKSLFTALRRRLARRRLVPSRSPGA